ncbi:hypothetical protein [Salimicrobium salexigens]|uniref:Heat induced stress protein YflT n=1 Tax=Salimicrobium salexigens TaxID=908941 RepID=A0ABY1KU52_9BACI|nr:hypothetical protein [Salimicrobium salexigens]SIS78268.1 hypothetical protein SAMN05421758_105236 [Salimicrobium salexigens]
MKQVIAYFANENDAESALTSLKKYKVEKERVEEIPQDSKLERVIPFTSGGFQADVAEYGETFNEALGNKGKEVTHLFQFEVEEEDHEGVLKVLQEHGAMKKE